MSKPAPRVVEVVESFRITPNMQRIVLSGPSLEGFPETCPGAYIKLLFDLNGDPVVKPNKDKPVAMRTYTINSFDAQKAQMTIDMVVHVKEGVTGPAAAWALSAKEGDKLTIAGPGSSKSLAENYDWVLFAGDMTALPSIRNYLKALPSDARGVAVIAIEHEADAISLEKPSKVSIHWVPKGESSLSDAIKRIDWQQGTPAAWVACEFSQMRKIRSWLKDDKQVPHGQVYISSYWREGRSEDQHKIDKRQDVEAFAQQIA
ncbi:siderophore-interacting protein [Alteromonas sp. 1_MG-2023]|uniref:siderophore-interacting protein n=1 Tax=Alteromonas sp. 1_MG-2023 TaxID=3062669 RepID=UPI0026E472F8|nr:siderophore-interacting protein [Alteromonas sp. 1_MG-2023]MDO6567016.1 siderophore-interacting protein [Alteromonas sp. 1_MG-2023]